MNKYRVTHTTEVEAETAYEAARIARRYQMRPDAVLKVEVVSVKAETVFKYEPAGDYRME